MPDTDPIDGWCPEPMPPNPGAGMRRRPLVRWSTLVEGARLLGRRGRDGVWDTVARWRAAGLAPTDDEWASIPTHPQMPYRSYLASDAWRRKRALLLRRAGHRCQVCNARGRLDIHHRTYERLGREHPADLGVLCRACHERFHEGGRRPVR